MASAYNARRSRGRLSPSGRVIQTCSMEFLHAICMEMYRTLAQPFVNVATTTVAASEARRAELVLYEVQRLLENPELFPSQSARVKFLALIALDSELQFSQACSDMVINSEIESLDKARTNNYSRRIYQLDMKPWENFLLNMAPGAPDDPLHRATTVPKSSFQMIPAVGLRIVADFEREEQEIARYIRGTQAPFGVEPAPTTLLIDFDKNSGEEIPRTKMVQHTERVIVMPSPFRAGRSIREDVCIHANQPVASIAHFLHHIDFPDAPPAGPGGVNNQSMFPLFCVRQWRGPTQYHELRFISKA